METIKRKYRRKVTDVNTIFYINLECVKITVFSPFELIVKEIASLGINTIDATISELKYKVSKIYLEDYTNRNFSDNPNYIPSEDKIKFTVIMFHL